MIQSINSPYLSTVEQSPDWHMLMPFQYFSCQAEMDEEGGGAESSKFLLSHDDPERAVDPEMQARLEALLEAAGEYTTIIIYLLLI